MSLHYSIFNVVSMVMCHLSYRTCLTPGSVEPREAAAGEGAPPIQAAGSIHTGVRIALVHIHLAQPAPVALHTLTPGRGGGGHISTFRFTKTKQSCFFPSERLLPETIDGIQAGASIQTGGAVTFVNVNLTAVPREADSTVTGVTACHVLTHTSVQTGVGQTLVYFQLTTRSCRKEETRDSSNSQEDMMGSSSCPDFVYEDMN